MLEIKTANLIAQNSIGEILLVKRAQNQDESGLWSLPGGTNEKDENIEETLIREILEELNVQIIKYKLALVHEVSDSSKIVKAHYFIGQIEGEITFDPIEISDCKWFPIDKIPDDLAYNQNLILTKAQIL